MNFSKIKLSDIAKVIMGQSPPSAFYNDKGEGMPFFQGKTEFGSLYPRIEKHTTKVTKEAKVGDILFTVRAPVGEVNIANVDCCIGRGLAALRPKEENKYLYYKIQNDKVRFVLKSSGAIYDSINKDILSDTELKIQDSKSVRDKIGSLLWGYDYLIQNNLRRIELLEESVRLLYREWFMHLRFPGHEHTKITNGVPKIWGKKRLSELAYLTMGQSPKSQYYNEEGEGLPFHQGVTDFGARFVTHNKYCTVQNRIAGVGDILCSVRAPVGRLNITLDKIIIGRGLSALRSKSNNQSFLYYQLKNHFFQEDIIGGGTIFASTTRQQLEGQEFLQPENKMIELFEEYSKPIDEQVKNLFLQIQQSRKARDILLPRLMNGDIAV